MERVPMAVIWSRAHGVLDKDKFVCANKLDLSYNNPFSHVMHVQVVEA